MPVVVECLQCHKKVIRCPSQLREHTFCNRKCQGKWQSEHIIGKNHPRFKDSDALCLYCNKSFHVKYKELFRHKNHFCNRICLKKWLDENKRFEVKCDYCKLSIIIPLNQLRGSKKHFCNEKCHGRWQFENKKLIYCDYCGREKYIHKSSYKSSKHHYCSKECYHKGRGRYILGKDNPFYGKHHKSETIKKMIEKDRKKIKNLWKNPEYVKKVMNRLYVKPNKSERLLNEWIQRNFPNQWEFTGNGENGFNIGGKVPDWKCLNGRRKVIELFGEHVHSRLFAPKIKVSYNRTYQGTIEHYKKYGYGCLVIWYKELKNKKKVIEKIHGFTY